MGESVFEGLKREVYEETRLTVNKVIRPLSVFTNTTQIPEREDLQIVFLCTAENTEHDIKLNSKEHRDYKWIDPDKLTEYEIMDYVRFYCDSIRNG